MKQKSSSFRDSVIIVNPASGIGDSKERVETIKRLAKELHWEGSLKITTLKLSAYQIAQSELKKGKKHFIVCGGDGTVMEVIGALVKKEAVLGVVPLGTGNLLAKNLEIPLDIKSALRVALNGKVESIDIGKANDTYFAIMAGIGIDAEMIRGADRNLKKKLGMVAYIISAIKSIFISSGKYRVVVDKKIIHITRAKGVMIANMAKIAGEIEIVPGAHPQNGTLQIGIIKAARWYAWISLVFNGLRGKIDESPHYTLLKGNTIEITCLGKPRPYECDGNEFPPTQKLSVVIYPSALSVKTGI